MTPTKEQIDESIKVLEENYPNEIKLIRQKAQDKILDEVEELCKRYENDGAFTQGDLIRELRNRKDKK